MAENVLSVVPLSEPVNAFAQVAKEMRAIEYPNADAAREAMVNADWLDYLAGCAIPAQTRQPLILMALARLACDGTERERFATVIRAIDEQIAQRKNGKAPPSNGAKKGGFVIRDGEVVPAS